jgi:hypothetical protein
MRWELGSARRPFPSQSRRWSWPTGSEWTNNARALAYIGATKVLAGDPAGVADLERALAIALEANSPEATLAYANLGNAVISLGDLPRGFALQATATRQPSVSDWPSTCVGLGGAVGRGLLARSLGRGHERRRPPGRVDAGSPHFIEDVCRRVRGLIRLAQGEQPRL